ncbi:hypothetical protein [Aliarcobacter trophiarum]|uniref:hypothetical protein n=1 Tax=Aliarcobacter trophiarum TaxID=708186 RepID=UPI00100A7212|nr:hypothetical protein [Aliarcobacter trophiarum]RXI28462.1 hypothetical protein CRU89_00490 [Aliarcobacter trophiarum]
MTEFFLEHSKLILFFHLLSVVIWIGGMIVIRFSVHYSFLKIDDVKTRLERILENLKKFFYMVIICILAIYITAILMHIGLGLKANFIAILKEIILLIMTFIFIKIFIQRYKAAKFFKNNEYILAKKELEPIAKYLIPINIAFGLVEIYLGIALRGF